MVEEGEQYCPVCGAPLSYYDHVSRMVRTKGGKSYWLKIRRLRCSNPECNVLHREIPENVAPYKQYDINVIEGCVDRLITNETVGFEDRPNDITVKRWIIWTKNLVRRGYTGWLKESVSRHKHITL